jgi:phage tail sheath protein FI
VLPPAIDPVSTEVAAFVGQTVSGPTQPTLVTSFADYMRTFGDFTDPAESFLPFAVRGFFENGGRRAYIARVLGGATLDYLGDASMPEDQVAGLAALETMDDVSLVVIPDAVRDDALTAAIVDHCEIRKDRFALLSVPLGANLDVQPPHDSSYAAIYLPWVRVPDASGKGAVLVPAVGHVAGIYARTDIERGVHKAPANEAVHGLAFDTALGAPLERVITKVESDALNPRGINVIRDFGAGGGVRVWGARTMSRNPEWKYVSVRRLVTFLERSIERGLTWVVFEPNELALWQNVRSAVENFLVTCWRNGMLLGARPDEAFFVKCDRSTMSQNDIDNGRLVVMVGVAPARPAEFVIFRIGMWTADHPDD